MEGHMLLLIFWASPWQILQNLSLIAAGSAILWEGAEKGRGLNRVDSVETGWGEWIGSWKGLGSGLSH